MEKTIEIIKINIRAYDKFMTDEYLDKLNLTHLIGLCHPCDRNYILQFLKKNKIIDSKEKERILNDTIWKSGNVLK